MEDEIYNPTIAEFGKRFDHTTDVQGHSLEYKLCHKLEDWDRMLAFAADLRLSDDAIPRYRGREGIHTEDDRKDRDEQRISFTSIIGIHKNTDKTFFSASIFYFPYAMKQHIHLFRKEGDLLISSSCQDMIPSEEGLVYFGFAKGDQKIKHITKYQNLNAYLHFLRLFLDFYNINTDVFGSVKGLLNTSPFEPASGRTSIPILNDGLLQKIGACHPQAVGSRKFFEKTGMACQNEYFSYPDGGPVYLGRTNSLNLRL